VKRFHVFFIFVLLLTSQAGVYGYSVLSHEAVIDTAWEKSIQPLLLHRFPTLTPDQLREAHAYAYGGCIIQDLGYYPFGTKLFSDLVHYVRSGDFVAALLRDSVDADQYAFALGALAHYAADNNGHPLAVNIAVALLFPKLRRKYGDNITYYENPAAHLRTEFGFDVVQVAHGHYAPEAYHDFIGFQVSKPVLERAFLDTYSLDLKDVFGNLDLALGTYRYSVSSIIPTMTRAAWAAKKDEIVREMPGVTRKKFIYNISRASYHKEWGSQYKRPGPLARFLAFLFQLIPKIGPFRALAFKAPTPETELLFMKSFNTTLDRYRALIEEVKNNQLQFVNENLDVGKPTRAGVYPLADKTYARLLDKLASKHFNGVAPELRADILSYYADLSAPIDTKKHQSEWKKTLEELNMLKSAAPVQAAVSMTE
jgi:hypothetical protein